MNNLSEQQLLEQLTESYIPLEEMHAFETESGITLEDLIAQAAQSGRRFDIVKKKFETPNGGLDAITLEPCFVPEWNPMSVYFMDQVLFDSEFSKHKDAWRHALKYFKKVKPDAVVLLGALTRIDRPEYKIDELVSFWLTREELQKRIRNGDGLHDPLVEYMEEEFKIAKKRFGELREAAPDSDIYYIWSTDDGFSVNRMVHYLALRYRSELRTKISELKDEIKEHEKEARKKADKMDHLGKRARVARNRLRKSLDHLEEQLNEFNEEVGYAETEQRYARPRKESPVHQMLVSEGTELIMGKYKQICAQYGINFLVGESVINVNGNQMKVRENARSFDSPIKNRVGELTDSMSKSVDELAEQRILAVVEGHQGTYWFGRFDTAPSEDEVNKKFEGVFYPPVDSYQKSVYAVILPVFHDQEEVEKFLKGKRPERLSARKAVGNRNHFALKMFNNGGVSGLFGFWIDEEGRVGRDLTEYNAFKLKKSLSPKIYWEYDIRADMHLENQCTRIELIDGAKERGLRHLADDAQRTFMGKPLRVAALLTVGDCIEGNSSGWRGAGAESRRSSPFDVMKSVMQRVISQPRNLDEMIEQVAWVLGFNLEGPRENMGDLLRMLADYYLPEIEMLAEKSPFKTVFTGVGSNHSYLTLGQTGINPHEILRWYLDHVNLSDRALFDERDARSNAITLTLGEAVDGTYRFPPLETLVVHDAPSQGDAAQALAEFGTKFDTQLEIGGHLHVSRESAKRYRGRPNEIALAIAAAAFQGVTSTELYKPGIPRHKGTKSLYIPGGKVDTGQRIIFENTAPLLAYESRRAMRLNVKEMQFMGMYQ